MIKIISKTFKFPNFVEPATMDEEINKFFEELFEEYPSFNHKNSVLSDNLVFHEVDVWRTILLEIL